MRRRSRALVESLERRTLFTDILYNGGQGMLVFVENADGVNNRITLSTGPGAGNALIQDTSDTLLIQSNLASLGWTLSPDGHTAIGPESQITSYYLDTDDGSDTIAIQASDRPIKVQPRNAYDTVGIGTNSSPTGAQLVLGSVFFDTQFAGAGSLVLNDTGDPTPQTVAVTGTTVTGLTPGAITYDPTLSDLTIVSGTGGNTTTIDQTNDAPLFGGTQFRLNANGNDTVNVRQLASNSQVVTLELDPASVDTVNISNAGSSLGIYGNIVVDGFSGMAAINIDASADTFFSQGSVSLDNFGDGHITGVDAINVDFKASKLQSLDIRLGHGEGQNFFNYNVPSGVPANFIARLHTGAADTNTTIVSNPAGATLAIDGFGGNNAVHIGAFDILASGIQGTIQASNMGIGADAIFIFGSGATANNVAVSDTTVTGLVPATLNLFAPASVSVMGASAADTFNVTPSATTSFSIDGGPFAPLLAPADVMNVNIAGTGSAVLHLQNTAAGRQGSYTFSNRMAVSFSEVGNVTPALATIGGTIFNGQTGAPLAGVPLFLDENRNGSPDAGEPATSTDGSGNYQFTQLAAGTYPLAGGSASIVIPGIRQDITVAAGQIVAVASLPAFSAPTPGGPDLVGTLLGAPASVISGSKGSLKLKVTNAGSSAARGPLQVLLRASADRAVDPSDATIATISAGTVSLRPHASKTLTLNFVYPTSLTDGAYVILATVDSANTIAESNESNNAAASPSPVNIRQAFIDLTGSFGRLPAAIPTGKMTAVPLVITNSGNIVATGTISISFYASADGTRDAGDTFLTTIGGQKISIKPGTTRALNLRIRTPAGLMPAKHFLIAVVNADHTLMEQRLDNNDVVSPVALQLG